MIKKLLTRLLILGFLVVLIYFAVLNTETATVPIAKSDRATASASGETIRGNGVQYKSYDRAGNEIVSGVSRKVVQKGESQIQLEDGLELSIQVKGKHYRVKADSFESDRQDRQILTAKPGEKIYWDLEEVVLETVGPLFYGKDGVISTDAPVDFRMGEARGSSRGLRYKPETFLELYEECVFQAKGPAGNIRINARHIYFDNVQQRGTVREGILTSSSDRDHGETRLESELIELDYRGGRKGEPFLMVQAILTGEPTRFIWEQGMLVSNFFDVCFDKSGRWAEELLTGESAHFSVLSEDGYRVEGDSGQLNLVMQEAQPSELISRSPVLIEGEKEGGPVLRLSGQEGLETQFVDGKAHGTRLFGAPSFGYGEMEGRAGNLRALHHERTIIFSEGSELWNPTEAIRILADEILLADWDQEEKEIHAFKFVQITYLENSPNIIQSFGDELKCRLPSGYIKIKGLPAKVYKTGQTVEANTIEISQIDDELFDFHAHSDGNNEVSLIMASEDGVAHIVAKKLEYLGSRDALRLEHVRKAILPGKGELSCKTMEIGFRNKAGKKEIEAIYAEGDVLFRGAIKEGDKDTPVHCQSDSLRYTHADETLRFLGVGNEVVFHHPSGVFRGKELTYYLNDGSIRGDSEKHGTTKTTINLKEPSGDNKQPGN